MQNIMQILKEKIIQPCIIKQCENRKGLCLNIIENLVKKENELNKKLSTSSSDLTSFDKESFFPRGIIMSPNTHELRMLIIADNPGPMDPERDQNWNDVDSYLEEKWKVLSGKEEGKRFHQNLREIINVFTQNESIKLEEIYLTQNVKCGGFKGTNIPCAIRSICQEKWLKKEIEYLDPDKLKFVLVLGKNAYRSVIGLFEQSYPQLIEKSILIPHPAWPKFKNSIERIKEILIESS